MFSLLLMAMSCVVMAASGDDGKWHLVSEKNDIRIYRQNDDAARIKTWRGVTRFAPGNPAAFEALLNDYPAIPRWMHFISSGTEISRTGYFDRKMHFITRLPWPLSDRDVIGDFHVQQVSPTVLHIRAVNDRSAPLTEDYVRILELDGRLDFHFFPATKEVEVTYEVHLDPGGNIPAWAVNFVAKDVPYFTLLKLRRIVMEPQYQAFRTGAFALPW